jgi:hypothetical protein
VPVFCFGENDLFKQYPNPEGSHLRKLQTKVKDIATFSPPLFYGRGIFQYTFGFVPFRNPVHAVGELNNLVKMGLKFWNIKCTIIVSTYHHIFILP